MTKIHFICRGNVFRSIIAEAYFNSLKLPNVAVASSGTVATEYFHSNSVGFPRTLALLKRHGIDGYAKDHYGDQLNQSRVDGSNVVVCMNERAHKEAQAICKLPGRVVVWSVAEIGEPGRIARGEQDIDRLMEAAYREIVQNVNDLAAQLSRSA